MSKFELKHCSDCIAIYQCPTGKRNPIKRVCYSDEHLIAVMKQAEERKEIKKQNCEECKSGW